MIVFVLAVVVLMVMSIRKSAQKSRKKYVQQPHCGVK